MNAAVAQDDSAALHPRAAGNALFALHRLVELAILVLAIVQVLWLDAFGRNQLMAIGPVQLQTADVATLLSPVLAALLLVRRIRPPWVVLLFLALYCVSLARGVVHEGNAALVALRLDITFILLLVSVSTNGLDRIGFRTVERVFLAAGVAISALALARAAFGPNFLVDLSRIDVEIADDWNDGRVIGGASIIVLSVAIMLSIGRDYALGLAKPRPRFTPIVIFFLVIVAISGQRTASLGLLAALCFVAINRVRQLGIGLLLLAPLGLFVMLTGIVGFDPAMVENLGQDMGGREGTFAFRIQIWKGFLKVFGDWPLLDQLFGHPIGARPAFYLPGRVWSASLHSAYFGLMLEIGLIGALLFVIAVLAHFIRALIHFMQYRKVANCAAPELRVYGSMIMLLYGISYEWRDVMGLIAGMLFASVTSSREPQHRSHVPERIVPPARGPRRFAAAISH